MAQWYSAVLEIQRSPVQIPVQAKRKSLTGPIRTIPHQSLHTRVKYLKLSEAKTTSHYGTVVQCSTSRSPVQTPVQAKRKSLIGPIGTMPPPIPPHQSWIPEIVRGENGGHHGAVVEYRTINPGPQFKPHVGSQMKISHRSNQNNTTTISLHTRVKYLKLSEVKICHGHSGTVWD